MSVTSGAHVNGDSPSIFFFKEIQIEEEHKAWAMQVLSKKKKPSIYLSLQNSVHVFSYQSVYYIHIQGIESFSSQVLHLLKWMSLSDGYVKEDISCSA